MFGSPPCTINVFNANSVCIIDTACSTHLIRYKTSFSELFSKRNKLIAII